MKMKENKEENNNERRQKYLSETEYKKINKEIENKYK